jgi:hypothetical protein
VARLRLLALLVFSGAFAAGTLFVTYQLEGVRASVAEMLAERAGGRLEAGTLEIAGLRGVRIQGFEAELAPPGAPGLRFTCPEILFQVNLIGLLYGEATIEVIRVDGAVITLSPPASGKWITPRTPAAAEATAAGGIEDFFKTFDAALPTFAFRLRGEGCSVHVRDLSPGNSISLTNMNIDAYRLSDGADVTVSLDARMNGDDVKPLKAHARYGTAEDFDIRFSHGLLTAEDINVFLPSEQQVVTSGRISPTLRVSGFPGGTVFVSIDSPYAEFAVRDQPDFLPPLDGRISAVAQYDGVAQVLDITTANVRSQSFSGAVDGRILLSGSQPEFDLTLRADRLPVREALTEILAAQESALGLGSVELREPFDVTATLRGTPAAPAFSVGGAITGGSVELDAGQVPGLTGKIEFGRVEAYWDGSARPQGSLQVTGGWLAHAASGMRIDDLACTARLDAGTVSILPLSATFTGSPLVGEARHDIEAGTTEFSVSGTFANIGDTPIAHALKDFYLAGSVGLRASGSVTPAGISADIGVDATQAQIEFQWWLKKPPGIGTVLHGVHVDFVPKKHVKITGGVTLDATELTASVDLGWRGGKFELDRIRAKSPRLDAGTADRCLHVPYRLSGGGADDVIFDWDALPEYKPGDKFTVAGVLDEATLLARGVETPIHIKNARVSVYVETGATRIGRIEVHAEDASVPSLSEKWLLPLQPEEPTAGETALAADGAAAKSVAPASDPRDWTYVLRAEKIVFPPWRGVNFEGDATDDEETFDMHRFTAEVDEGSLNGSYRLEKGDNVGHLTAHWSGVPASYLLRHLELPQVLEGPMNGEVTYSVDNDDPATLKGTGRFDIPGGRFSADVLAAQMAQQFQTDSAALPPSLEFSMLRSDLVFEGDRVKTPDLYLEAEGLTVNGSGGFVTNGDIDYAIKVALSPETADKIEILHTYFNIEGHKLSQSDLELEFQVAGPMFRPTGSVEGLPPVGVTLVSGAFEMTGEALKVIDLPRKLLVDMFKIGGGIAGARRQQQ